MHCGSKLPIWCRFNSYTSCCVALALSREDGSPLTGSLHVSLYFIAYKLITVLFHIGAVYKGRSHKITKNWPSSALCGRPHLKISLPLVRKMSILEHPDCGRLSWTALCGTLSFKHVSCNRFQINKWSNQKFWFTY